MDKKVKEYLTKYLKPYLWMGYVKVDNGWGNKTEIDSRLSVD